MLQKLYVRNYAIIEDQEIAFSRGLNTITGETGAGKSIMLGALQLTMGARADSSVLHDRDQKAIVEATYGQIPEEAQRLLAANEIDIESELTMRREIAPGGKSRAFINDTPVRLSTMQEVSALLIDLHQQFESLEIQNPTQQYDLLDAYAGLTAEVSAYREQYAAWRKLAAEIEHLREQLRSNARERDLIAFELEELDQHFVEPAQFADWESEYHLQENAAELLVTLNGISDALTLGDSALVDALRDVGQRLDAFRNAGSEVRAIRERLLSVVVEMEDLGQTVIALAENVNPDPEVLQSLEEKLTGVRRLLLKHGFQEVQQLVDLRENHRQRLDAWGTSDEALRSREKTFEKIRNELTAAAGRISDVRTRKAEMLAAEVVGMLRNLEMKNARFEIRIERTDALDRNGMDNIDFVFAANKGGSLQSVGKVASGGEISRLNLCLKSIVSKTIDLPCLVFDEIDTGVSGQVALRMGEMLKSLAENHQVIMITHSPQIAAQGDYHYFVAKQDLDHRTIAVVRLLDHAERILEIAKMLSGDPPTPSAVANARELLKTEND